MRARLKAGRFHAFALAAMIALVQAPFGQFARAETKATVPTTQSAITSTVQPAAAAADQPAVSLANQPVNAPADQPANAPAAQKADAPKKASIAPADSKVSDKLRKQAEEKNAVQDRLRAVPSTSGARPGDPIDKNQPALANLVAGGNLKMSSDTVDAYAYVQPYQEPADYAHRNYCGPGAATVLLSHWDAGYARSVDIDKLGDQMNMDPNSGVWVRDIVKPVNDHLNAKAGQDLNWYRLGEAQSLDEFRWMLDYDIGQNGVPLITSLQTGGLPGWGDQDVGHIVAVYGYHKDADGTEWVTYVDTAPGSAGFEGKTFNTVQLGTFWQAVSQNSAQVW